ncbi:Mical-like protein, partial [Globisporangium splendens]
MAETTAASDFTWESAPHDKNPDEVSDEFPSPQTGSSSSSSSGEDQQPVEDNQSAHDQTQPTSSEAADAAGESKPESSSSPQKANDEDNQGDEKESLSSLDTADDDDEDLMRESTVVHRRMTYIGEGLLDVDGMDAIDRLSDLSDLEKLASSSVNSEVKSPQQVEEASSTQEETKSEPPAVQASPSGNKLLAFLAKASSGTPSPSAPSAPKPAPKPVSWPAFPPTVPTKSEAPKRVASPPRNIENRRTKLLDFLANDIGERYLDGVYQDEIRNEPEEKEEEEVESEQDRQRRARAASDRLRAFLAQEKGERLHRFERNSDEQRNSFSSVASSASSNGSSDGRPKSKEPSKLLEFVSKVVPEKPKFVIFDPADAVSETEELEHLVAEEAQKKKKKREDREKARQKVMSFLAEEEVSSSRRRGAVSTIKSVDESKVKREAVEDRYGRVGLLDFLDRTETAQQRKIRWATSGHSSDSSASPTSSHSSSPKTRSSSPKTPTSPDRPAPAVSKQAASPPVSPPVSSHSTHTGNRLTSFLSKIAKHTHSLSPEKDKKQTHSPPAPSVSASADHSESSSHSEDDYPMSGPRQPSAKMAPVLSALDQIVQSCSKHELNDVAIARVTTLLTSISQIVKEDVQKGYQPVRRWSNVSASPTAASTPSRVKSGKEIEEFGRQHASVKSTNAPAVNGKDSASTPAMLELRSSEVKVTVAPSAVNSFNEFESAQNLLEIVAAFHKLLADCGLTDFKLNQPWLVYEHVKAAVGSKLGFRQKQLFKLLDAKLSTDVYKKRPAAHKRVCIIGAGPVGLRAAVEMSLLGAQVVMLEKRKHFSRENILHLWPWVVQDLTSLGAKVFFPQFCHSTAYFHVGTRQLQCILLKVALLLGVTFFPATAFEGVASPESIETGRRPYYTVLTKPQIPWMEFTAVLGASGTQDKLSEQSGIKRFVFSRKEAIGLVCYFPNHGTTEEKNVAEFSWTIQFKQQMFAKMREIGVDLENIVYYRGEMHYVVMTPKRENLIEQGVMKVDYPNVADLVMDDNINKPVLHEYLKRIVKFVNIPQKSDFARVRVFDFSSRTRADKAASILTSKGKKLYVGLIGDSLMEPFWPEGLGTCRGFLSALDGCWMVAQIGFNSDEQILADRELAYRIIQHVSGFRRDDLQKNVRKYNVDPKTRYVVKFPQLC